MGRVCGTLEGMRIPRDKKEEEEEKGEEFDLSLELSIGGGRYAKSENSPRGKTIDPNSGISRPGFSFGLEYGSGSADPQRRREVQAAKRQEARKKMEEKLKKSSMAEDIDDDRLCLEARKFQSRVRDREAREREGGFLEEREREKNGIGDLNLSLFTGSKNIPSTQQMVGMRGCLFPNYPARGNGFAYPNLGMNIGGGGDQRNERNRNLSADYDSGYSNNRNGIDDIGNWKLALPNRSLEQASSCVSDYPTTSHKGGSSSDTGSHSSSYIYRNALDRDKSNDPSQANPEHCPMLAASLTEKSKSETYFEQTNHNTCSAYNENQASSSLKEMSTGCPTPNNNNNNINNAAQGPCTMPCVSTTGNGPNGRKVTGFLYKYNRTEVIIMCVCHRSLFSPAEFVEHAGGVDVLNPLRHITMIAHS